MKKSLVAMACVLIPSLAFAGSSTLRSGYRVSCEDSTVKIVEEYDAGSPLVTTYSPDAGKGDMVMTFDGYYGSSKGGVNVRMGIRCLDDACNDVASEGLGHK